MTKILTISLCLFVSSTICGQANVSKRCGTTEYYQKKLGKVGYEQFKQKLNGWLQRGIAERRTRRTVGSTTSIAVIVHIFHQGQTVGISPNLSAAQVRSQIIVLNEDYNRLNADTSNTPNVFVPVAAKVGIHFGLATINPDNQVMAEPGINRIKVDKDAYTENEIDQLRAKYTWNPDKYLNLFITKIKSGDADDAGEILGYANLPNNSTLTGISPTDNSFGIVDGVVITPTAFGSNYTKEGSSFKLQDVVDRGRTATHEVGHYLGLLHIWGDGDCDKDDFVSDTPIAAKSHNSYTECGTPQTTCGTLDMFQNYMDYTSDVCMNLFTKGQKERMLTAIEKADRRRNLNSYYEKLTGSTPPTALPVTSPITAEDLTFYPNPTTGQFKLKVDNGKAGTYELKIINSLGQVVFKNSFAKQVQNYIYTGDVSHLANGIYFISLESKDYRRTLKFIIAK